MNDTNEKILIGMDGRPCFGIFDKPPAALNIEDFRPYGAESAASS